MTETAISIAFAKAAVRQAAMIKNDLLARSLEGEPVGDGELLSADRELDRAERALALLMKEPANAH
jgi:hypothetical protein